MIRPILLAALLAIALFQAPARAMTEGDVVVAELLPGWRTESGTYMVALRLTLAPGWKTYWRSPGDAGIPPMFNWSGSRNLAAVRLHWPRPHVFWLNGMQSIGYQHELVLPLELTPSDPSQPIRLRAEVDLGVCLDICVPSTVSFAAEVGGAGNPNSAINAALAARPVTGTEAGLAGIGCSVEQIADGLRLTAQITLPHTGGDETVVFEPGPAPIWVSEAVVTRRGGTLTATSDFVSNDGGPISLNRSAMVVTVLGKDRAVEIRGCPAP
jgi:DsbC/DsbD-like thiol-disulfide interchange protein